MSPSGKTYAFAQALNTSLATKDVGRNFPGEGSRGGLDSAIIVIPGGSTPILLASMVKMKEFLGQGGGMPLFCLYLPTVYARYGFTVLQFCLFVLSDKQ